jgi:O-succinylbenzoic acid--CoA ligase
MTETLSHIALRRLSGSEASPFYRPFPSVKLSLSADHTLIIDAPLVCDKLLTTNDVAELLPDGSFRILGRKDNIINTGGVKIQIETVEQKLRALIDFPFAITSVPDPKFGEAVVLLIEKAADLPTLQKQMEQVLSKYERPKHICEVEAIPLTETGKINRPACKALLMPR